jgi:hypothetical protein
VLLLREAERKHGVCLRLAEAMPDRRDPDRIRHAMFEMVTSRVLAIACGHEDAAHTLKQIGQVLASCGTPAAPWTLCGPGSGRQPSYACSGTYFRPRSGGRVRFPRKRHGPRERGHRNILTESPVSDCR